ncbi:MAG: hypothetical protein KIT84_25095 [Labilithrix sp.]|nr:hypothetical protein [Labilithrix sp.]MCW5814328.1 hypothetical protein [Labilithrix sp.]
MAPARDAGPDTRKPPEKLPPPSNPTGPDDSGAVDPKTLYPPAWNREDNPRDASLDVASERYCDGLGTAWEFCWDFTDEATAISGWNEVFDAGGTHEQFLGGGPPARQRALRSTVLRSAGDGPHKVALRYLITGLADNTQGFTLSFSFHVPLVETYAVIGAMALGNDVHGLAVYPTGCVAPPCLGESTHGPPPQPDVVNRRPFDQNAWYRAAIQYVPKLVGGKVTWGATITVGGVVVGTREADAFPAADVYPSAANLFVGVFDTQTAGNTQVELDDILVE